MQTFHFQVIEKLLLYSRYFLHIILMHAPSLINQEEIFWIINLV